MKCANDVINTVAFIKKPVDKLNKEIDNINERIIVIKGIKGCGKTSVLLKREKDSQKTDNMVLYQYFGIKKEFDETFIPYYELKMAENLLSYIQNSNMYFKLYSELKEDFTKNPNRCNYIGYYTKDLLSIIKKALNKNKATLMIDCFEEYPKIAQEYISKYFDMFDKVILTTNDSNYNADYKTVYVEYSKNKSFVYEMLKRYIKTEVNENEIDELKINMDYITNDIVDYLIEKTNGNLKLMKRVVLNMKYKMTLSHKSFFSKEIFLKNVKNSIDEKVLTDENVKKLYLNSSNFYI